MFILAICLIVFLTNIVIDPYGKNGLCDIGINKIKIIKDERISKFAMLVSHPNADSFIFGSSRGLILDPEVVERVKGGETLNMSFSSATADEYLLYTKYIFATQKVKNIIIGIDLFAYADGFDSTGTLPQTLRNYFNLDNNYSISNYFSLKMFERSYKTIKYNLFHDYREVDGRYTEKGKIMVKEYLDAAGSTERFNVYIKKYVVGRPSRWATRFDSLDYNRLEALEEIKRLCQANHVNLYLFTSPLYIKQITMKEGKFPLQQKLLQYIVNNIHPVMDFNAMDSINLTPENFIDEFHYSYAVADSILTQILTGEPMKAELKGVYLDKHNIDAYIEETKQKYSAFYQASSYQAVQ